MKTLILFRHGKSDWDADFDTDHERPLAKRGIKASKAMGRWISDTDQIPGFCAVSSALRTRETYEYASEAGSWETSPVITEGLYGSGVEEYIEIARQAPDDRERILVLGHEPTCSMAVSWLIGGAAVYFPTAAMARIDFDIDSWRELRAREGTLIWFQPPKFL